jgi:hypothetical protein
VARVLEGAQPVEDHDVAEVDVRGGRVDPQLHPQRTALAMGLGQACLERSGGQALLRAARERGGLRGGVEGGVGHPGQC